MSDVFISYASADRSFVESLAGKIQKAGYSVWWDQAIIAGSQFPIEIERELNAAAAVVVVWSAESVKSLWVRNEAEVAAKRNVLVPLRRDHIEPPLPYRLLHTIDFSSDAGTISDACCGELLKALAFYRNRSHEAYRIAADARIEGRADAADKLLQIMHAAGEFSERSRLDFVYHEFARLGDHLALPTLIELRQGAGNPFVQYATDLLIGLCRLAGSESRETIQELSEPRRSLQLTLSQRLTVALHEVFAFGAIGDTELLEAAWTTLARVRPDASERFNRHPQWDDVRSYDRAVVSVLYGEQGIKSIIDSLRRPLRRGLIHLAAANCQLVRKATPVLTELESRARQEGWRRQPTVRQLRRRLREFERALLPTAGTLFSSRRNMHLSP